MLQSKSFSSSKIDVHEFKHQIIYRTIGMEGETNKFYVMSISRLI